MMASRGAALNSATRPLLPITLSGEQNVSALMLATAGVTAEFLIAMPCASIVC